MSARAAECCQFHLKPSWDNDIRCERPITIRLWLFVKQRAHCERRQYRVCVARTCTLLLGTPQCVPVLHRYRQQESYSYSCHSHSLSLSLLTSGVVTALPDKMVTYPVLAGDPLPVIITAVQIFWYRYIPVGDLLTPVEIQGLG